MATVEGVLFLSRLVAALHLVLGLSLGAGVRFISQVLELAGLDPFMANSVRWHQDRAQTLERSVRSFGREERLRMCAVMKPKSPPHHALRGRDVLSSRPDLPRRHRVRELLP